MESYYTRQGSIGRAKSTVSHVPMNTRHNAAAVSFWRHTFRPQYVDHTVNQIAKREYNVRDHLFQSSRVQCQYLQESRAAAKKPRDAASVLFR